MSIRFFTCSRDGVVSLEKPETQMTQSRNPSIPELRLILPLISAPQTRREQNPIIRVGCGERQTRTAINACIQPIAGHDGNGGIPQARFHTLSLARFQIGTYDNTRPRCGRGAKEEQGVFQRRVNGSHLASHLLHRESEEQHFLTTDKQKTEAGHVEIWEEEKRKVLWVTEVYSECPEDGGRVSLLFPKESVDGGRNVALPLINVVYTRGFDDQWSYLSCSSRSHYRLGGDWDREGIESRPQECRSASSPRSSGHSRYGFGDTQ